MLRRVIRLSVLFVVLGAALNMLVASACALLISPEPQTRGVDTTTLAALRREFFERAGPDPGGSDPGRLFVSVAHRCPGVEFLDVMVEDRDTSSDFLRGPAPYIAYTRAGWPMRALEGEWHHNASRVARRITPHTKWGISIERWTVRGDRMLIPRMIPLRPRWPGFAINLAFWTCVAAWGCGLVVGSRRFIRWRRHLCVACGYPIGSSPVCTECGRRLRIPARLSACP